jgi:hypothetical protein
MSLSTAPVSVNGVLDGGLYDFEQGFIELVCHLAFQPHAFSTTDDLWNHCVVKINEMTHQLFRSPPPNRPEIPRPERVDTLGRMDGEGGDVELRNIGNLSRTEEEEINAMLHPRQGTSGPSSAMGGDPLQFQGDVSHGHSPGQSATVTPTQHSPHRIVTPSPPPRGPSPIIIHNPSATRLTLLRLRSHSTTADSRPLPLPVPSPVPVPSPSPSPVPSPLPLPLPSSTVNGGGSDEEPEPEPDDAVDDMPRPWSKRPSMSSSSSSPSLPPIRGSGRIAARKERSGLMKETPTRHRPKRRRVQLSAPRARAVGKPSEARPSAAPVTPTAARSSRSQNVRATVPPLLAMFPVASDIRAAPWMPESLWERDNEDLDGKKMKSRKEVNVHIHFSRAAHSEHYPSG